MYKQMFELNTINNKKDSDFLINSRLNPKSPIVEIFSALIEGRDTSAFGEKLMLLLIN